MEGFERQSGISKIVNVSQEKEAEILTEFSNRFEKHSFHIDGELEKTPEQEGIINGLIEHFPDFIKSYGGSSLKKITSEFIHLLDWDNLSTEDKEIFNKLSPHLSKAIYVGFAQAIYVRDVGETPLIFARRVAHELIHLYAFDSYTFTDDSSKDSTIMNQIKPRRMGFEIYNREPSKSTYFKNLNEAITEELAKRFDQTYFPIIPKLKSFYDQREGRKHQILNQYQNQSATDLVEDAVDFFVEDETLKYVKYSYAEERKTLKNLIKELYSKNQNMFESEEEVFKLFVKSTFTGNLLEVARLIDNTFGKGSFAELGEKM